MVVKTMITFLFAYFIPVLILARVCVFCVVHLKKRVERD
jgi:hypothetical protein